MNGYRQVLGMPLSATFVNGPLCRLIGAVLLAFLGALIIAAPAFAKPAQATHITASLVAEGPAQPGKSVTLAIAMKPDPGWHGYWLNPGDAGLGMQLDWELPSGVTAGMPVYPVPDRLLISGLMNHVFKGDYAILVPLQIPASAKPGEALAIAVKAQWLACTDEICVPEQARLETRIQIGGIGKADPRFDGWRAALPAPLNADASFALAGDSLRLAIPLPSTTLLQQPHLFLAQDRVAAYAAPQQFSWNGETLIIEVERPKNTPADPTEISGVLRLDDLGSGLSFTASKGTVPAAGTALATAEDVADISALPLLLLGALAGGLLLNIMPCVFPILSLKALSLVRAGEGGKQARSEGLAYTGGVIVACLALGVILLALRAAGQQVGWAFQLQEPGIIVLLLLLSVAITANFLGLYEFSPPGFSSGNTQRSAFATGLLAAFAATPCTGPFMAAAMGAALLLPISPALLLFAALGLGLALPFLLIAYIPALRRALPRPGPWMNTFRRWMALPMGLTAAALLWLASRIGGTQFALFAALLLAVLVIVLVIAGGRQRKGQSAMAITVGGLLIIALAGFAVLPRVAQQGGDTQYSVLNAEPFSQSALNTARASGKPVFVWMTADWCITCKVNEKVAIERDTTAVAFEAADVVVLRGDWTRRDPEITRYLTAHGAAGVPFYMWYSANTPAKERLPAQQLPQILTPGMLSDLAQGKLSAVQ